MTMPHELIVSARDAEALALMLGERGREPDAEAALYDLLAEASFVPHAELPPDRVAMNSRVTYESLPGGERRSVTLVYPVDAEPAEGRISVLSPIGLALLGRNPGARAPARLPGGRAATVRVLETERGREPLAA